MGERERGRGSLTQEGWREGIKSACERVERR